MNQLLIRWGWYRYSKQRGQPISIWHALWGEYPRFGPLEGELHKDLDKACS